MSIFTKAEKILSLDQGSVWNVKRHPVGVLEVHGRTFEGRPCIEVCFNEQRDSSPAGYIFIEEEPFYEEIDKGLL